jgi:deaminated glutathione amidase
VGPLCSGSPQALETPMKIACVQTNPQTDLAENVLFAEKLVAQAAREGAQWVVLPEMFPYMGPEAGRLASADALGEGLFLEMSRWASEHRIFLVGGTHAEKSNIPGKVYNTSVTYAPSGEMISYYRKIHLFNLRDPQGRPLYCESDVFAPGNAIAGYSISLAEENYRCLTAVCYDLRFPEIVRLAGNGIRHEKYDVVFFPSAFTHQTGQDHWEVLLRARAIENQCWVVGCNQTGFHSEGKKRNYGHSLVVDPWGKVVAQMNEEVGILWAEISQAPLQEARTKLPALSDRVL